MTSDSMVSVMEIRDYAKAEVIRASLENHGIPCYLENAHQAGFSNILVMRLLVQAADEQAARAFIAEHEHAPLE